MNSGLILYWTGTGACPYKLIAFCLSVSFVPFVPFVAKRPSLAFLIMVAFRLDSSIRPRSSSCVSPSDSCSYSARGTRHWRELFW